MRQVVLEFVELSFHEFFFFLPGTLKVILTSIGILQFAFQGRIGQVLVLKACLQPFNFLGQFVDLLTVFLLQFVTLVAQGVEFIVQLGSLTNHVHILVVQFVILTPVLLNATSVFCRHVVKAIHEFLVLGLKDVVGVGVVGHLRL